MDRCSIAQALSDLEGGELAAFRTRRLRTRHQVGRIPLSAIRLRSVTPRQWVISLALAITAAASAASGPPAHANIYTQRYCAYAAGSYPLPGDTWCNWWGWDLGWPRITYNSADYLSGGITIRVGIKQTYFGGGDINRKFGDNHVATNSACRETRPDVANASSPSFGNRWIYGLAQWTDQAEPCVIAARRTAQRVMTHRTKLSRVARAAVSAERDDLAVLKRARTSRDSLPGALQSVPDAKRFEWSASGARAADPAEDSWSATDQFFVIPGLQVCLAHWYLLTGESGLVCNTPSAIANGEVVLTEDTDQAGEVAISGLAPDGVAAVSIKLASMTRAVRTAVRDNVFALVTRGDAADEIAELKFLTSSGASERVRR